MHPSSRYVWKQVPLFRAIWPFVLGIILGIFAPDLDLGRWSVMFLGALFVLAFSFGRSFPLWTANFQLLAILLSGYALTAYQTDRLSDHHISNVKPEQDSGFIAKVISDPIHRERSVKMEVRLMYAVTAKDTLATHGKMLVYMEPTEGAKALLYGDHVAFSGRLARIPPPQNPNEFNYQRYMHFHQVSNQVYLNGDQWNLIEQGRGWRRQVFALQHEIIETIRSFDINDRELAILSALLVGYKHYLSSDQVNAFASAGAMHVLAVSGLHVGIIFLLLNNLLCFLDRGRIGKVLKGVLMIAFLWFYATLTGLSPSVTRSATMFSFVIAATQFRKRTDIFNTLASSAMVLLIYNPFLIVEVGFQLSYLAVLGIVLLQPRIYELWQPKWWLAEKMWAITAVSLAAQAATFPLALLYFHQFPNYFLLSNLVVIPAATVILPLGIALVCLHWIPLLSSVLAWLLYQLVHWLDQFIQWVEKLPMALLLGIDISIFETYLLYMVVAASCAFLITKRYAWLTALMVTLIAVEVSNIIEAQMQKHQRLVVFHKARKHTSMDFISGTNHVLLADSALTNDFDQMRFHIHHHWWNRDLQTPTEGIPGFNQNGPWVQFDSLSILMLDSSTVMDCSEAYEVDLLYIKDRTRQHPSKLLKSIKPETVILAASLDWRSHRYWMKLCKDQLQKVHSIKADGAFQVEWENEISF